MQRHPRLVKRGDVFYYRASIPADIRATYPKREEVRSLRTRDPVEARRLARFEDARVEALFAAHRDEQSRLRAPEISSLTADQIRSLADTHYALCLEQDEANRMSGFDGEDSYDAFVNDLEEEHRIAKELYAQGIVPGFVRNLYPQLTKRLGVSWNLAHDSPSWSVLGREMVKASVRAIEARKERNQGNIIETPEARAFQPTTKGDDGVTISDLFNLWKREHLSEGKSRRTVHDFQKKVDAFISFLGHEDAKRVTRKNIVDFCDKLRFDSGLSARTVSTKYLAAIRLIYRAGWRSAIIEYDPTKMVTIKVPKPVLERPKGFTDSEASAILSAALSAPETLGRMAEHNKLAIRWAPWICAYTGARITEITQLRREDFQIEEGIHCIRITPEAGSVKTGKYRYSPIHPHLVEMGLIDCVSSKPMGPLFYLPGERDLESGHTRAASVSGKISKWVREVAKVTDTRIQPNHGWRHRFKTTARRVGIPREYVDAIQGHDDGSASVNYGDYPMSGLYREILKIPRYEV
jgi:integrase